MESVANLSHRALPLPHVDLISLSSYTLKGSQQTSSAAPFQPVAPSFNGRTSDSDSLDRGSNPWGQPFVLQSAFYRGFIP
jgi:hypothetical protein